MRANPADGPRRAEITLRTNQKAMVPEWVAYSVYDQGEWRKSGFLGPRFARVPVEAAPPPRLQGLRGRFRHAAGTCRCVVPPSLPGATAEMLAAIEEAISFFETLINSLQVYTVGKIGVPDVTRAALDDAAKCWDWGTLLATTPKIEHYRAFLGLYGALKPTLKFARWPEDTAFDYLEKSWPGERGENGAFHQYQRLMRRVRVAAKTRPAWRCRDGFVVEPVMGSAFAASLGLLLKAASRAKRRCILHVISTFVAQSTNARNDGEAAPRFEVGAKELAGVGYGRTRSKARGGRHEQEYRGQTFASLSSSHMAGRLVRVHATMGAPVEEQIARALLTDPAFAAPDSTGGHCWHAIRVYMRASLLRAPESGCERWGSLLHALWDPVASPEPHRMVSRLLIREAGYDGTGSREDIVHELAAALEATRKTVFSNKKRRRTDTATSSENLDVRRGLQEQAIDREQWKLSARPCALLPSAERAVQDALRLGRNGALQALPVQVENAQSARKSRAGSVVAEALAKFMASEEGRQWQEDKKAIFGSKVLDKY